jgi:hypothetical protein
MTAAGQSTWGEPLAVLKRQTLVGADDTAVGSGLPPTPGTSSAPLLIISWTLRLELEGP